MHSFRGANKLLFQLYQNQYNREQDAYEIEAEVSNGVPVKKGDGLIIPQEDPIQDTPTDQECE